MATAVALRQAALPGIVNVASVPHRSPFRYPGGKTWLVPHVRRWLASLPNRPAAFVEPFAGGAIVGLTVAFENLADRVALVERDEDVSAVWRTILNGQGRELAKRITQFDMTRASVETILGQCPKSLVDRAFVTIVKNRAHRGGILAPGASLMKTGENGRGVASRWYPATLENRILEILQIKRRLSIAQGDGIEAIEGFAGDDTSVLFVDPPYTVAGRRLYRYSELDHERLFEVMSGTRGDFLMTYDNAAPIRNLARKFGFKTAEVSMKNTHHAIMTELLIGRDLDWVTSAS